MGSWEQRRKRSVSSSWLRCSLWPLVWVWNPEDKLTEIPSKWQNSAQNLAVNWGPQFPKMLWGRPCSLKTLMRSLSVSLVEESLGRGTKWTIIENLSTTVRMTVLPNETGWPVTKSTDMSDQGRLGTGKSCSKPKGDLMDDLAWVQVGQATTYSWDGTATRTTAVGWTRCVLSQGGTSGGLWNGSLQEQRAYCQDRRKEQSFSFRASITSCLMSMCAAPSWAVVERMGQRISLVVLWTRTIWQSEIESMEKESPTGLLGVQTEILQVLMISEDEEGWVRALEPMAPHVQSQLDR